MKPTRIPARSLLLLLALTAPPDPALARGGKAIDPNYLSITDCPDEPGCPALVLLDERELIYQTGLTVYRVKYITKIFTNEGVAKYADAEFPPTEQGGWLLEELSGRTILPDGSAIQLKRDNIREKPLKVGKRKVWTRTAAFAGVVPGAIVEYAYELNTAFGSVMPVVTWEFQKPIPVLSARFKVKPGTMQVGWARTGIDRPDFTKTDGVGVFEFRAENVPPISVEPSAPSEEALRTRFYFYIGDLQDTWIKALAGRAAGKAGGFLEGGAGPATRLKDLVSPADPPMTKVDKIYRFIQKEIGTDEERTGQSGEAALKEAKNAAEVLSRGFGSELERTMLFLALVKEAGLTPSLLLIESRRRGILNHLAPDETQFDSFAAAVKMNDEWTFYDPATRHCPFGMLSLDKAAEQDNAILIMPDKSAGREAVRKVQQVLIKTNEGAPFRVVRIPFYPASKNVLLRQAGLKLGSDGVIEGEVTEQGSGLVDLVLRQALEERAPADRPGLLREKVAATIPDAEVTNPSFEDLESFEKPVTIKYRLRVSEAVSSVGDRLIVTPSLFGAWLPNRFSATTRRTPVYFPLRQSTQDRIQLELPEGYAIDTLPPASRIQEGPLALTIAFTEDEGRIEILRLLVIDAAAWPAADYSRLRAFFEKVQEADRQVVVLKKEPAP